MQNQQIKQLITAGIKNGILEHREECIRKNDYITKNGLSMDKWDKINNSVNKTFINNGEDIFSVVNFKRGLFEGITIYNGIDREAYLLIRKDNYERLMKLNRKEKAHYIEAALFKNNSNRIKSQMTFDMNQFSDTYMESVSRVQEKIFKDLEPEKVKLVVVNDRNGLLVDIRCVYLNYNFEHIEKEQVWYTLNGADVDYHEELDNNNEVNIPLKIKEKAKDIKENIIKIKRENKKII